MSRARIRQVADRVHLELDGKLVDLPWDAALELARGILAKARLAESHARADGIIYDSAILLRAGSPFGLAPTRRHLNAAIAEAVSHRDLRRWMPGGVRSQEAVGAPAVISHAPRNTA